MVSPVVVDGRLTREKLDELLALGAEHAELDFKATLDLTTPGHRLGLVKDLIAMSNAGSGGYVVVGVNEDGTVATGVPAVDATQFDSADLAQQIGRHVVTAPVVTSQRHEVDGRMLVLIHVAPPVSHLPAIISKSGEYADGKRMKVVLVEGVLYIREGTHTVTATDGHWMQMLTKYRAGVVSETREGIDALIAKVVDGLGETTAGTRLVPLAIEMDDATFAEAVQPYFDAPEGQNKLRRFLRTLRATAGVANADARTQEAALNKLCIAAAQAVFSDARESFGFTLDLIYDLYIESVGSFDGDYATQTTAEYWLSILLRLLAIGATAVTTRAWWAIEPLVNKGVTEGYPVWLRHAIVHASRANLLSGGGREAAMVLVRARALVVTNPTIAPGLEGATTVGDDQELPKSDSLLNALCQFDYLWCTVAVATHPDKGDPQLFYPSCAALFQERSNPLITLLAMSEGVRQGVLPNTPTTQWAEAMDRVMEVAINQSHQYRAWWNGFGYDYRVESFVKGDPLTRILGG